MGAPPLAELMGSVRDMGSFETPAVPTEAPDMGSFDAPPPEMPATDKLPDNNAHPQRLIASHERPSKRPRSKGEAEWCREQIEHGKTFGKDSEPRQLQALRDIIDSDDPYAIRTIEELLAGRNFAVQPSEDSPYKSPVGSTTMLMEEDAGVPPLAAVFMRPAFGGQMYMANLLMQHGADPDLPFRNPLTHEIATARSVANTKMCGVIAVLTECVRHRLLVDFDHPDFLPQYPLSADDPLNTMDDSMPLEDEDEEALAGDTVASS